MKGLGAFYGKWELKANGTMVLNPTVELSGNRTDSRVVGRISGSGDGDGKTGAKKRPKPLFNVRF